MAYYNSHSTGKRYELVKGRQIGAGAYGGVGLVEGREDFVYKEVELDRKPGEWIALTRELRIKAVYRELAALKKLGLLEGYIRENNRIIMIMRKLSGAPEKEMIPHPQYNPNNINIPPKTLDYAAGFDEQRAVATFKALLRLNRKGIYHLDANPENSLIERLPSGELKANLVDFGNASEYSSYIHTIQNMTFDGCRPFMHQTYVDALRAAKKAVDQEYATQDIFYGALYIAAGIGVVTLFGLNSFVFWQVVRSSVANHLVREIRASLDMLDLMHAKSLDSDQLTQQRKNLLKLLINTGYMLVNIYNLSNLYYCVPSLELFKNWNNLVELFHSGAMDYAMLDKLSSEVIYLYTQAKMTVGSLSNMIEKAPPADYLLAQADMQYKYNPTLLFKYAATKAKEAYYGQGQQVPAAVPVRAGM